MRIFWAIYGVLLLLCEALFMLRVQAVWRVFMRIKKSYALAPEAIADGHRQRETRSELRPALLRCRTELLSWAAIGQPSQVAIGQPSQVAIGQLYMVVKVPKCVADYILYWLSNIGKILNFRASNLKRWTAKKSSPIRGTSWMKTGDLLRSKMMNTNKKAVSAATEHGKEMCIHTNPTRLVYMKERNLSNDIRGGDLIGSSN